MRLVTVRYYSLHLLRTIDVNRLLERLAAEVPDCSRIVIDVMAEEERGVAARAGTMGIIEVRERIHVLVGADDDDGGGGGAGGAPERRRDLEEEAERFSC